LVLCAKAMDAGRMNAIMRTRSVARLTAVRELTGSERCTMLVQWPVMAIRADDTTMDVTPDYVIGDDKPDVR